MVDEKIESELTKEQYDFIEKEKSYFQSLKNSNQNDAAAKMVQRIAKHENTLNRLKIELKNREERLEFFRNQWKEEEKYLLQEIEETKKTIKPFEHIIRSGKSILGLKKGGK